MKIEALFVWLVVATIMGTILFYHYQTIDAASRGIYENCEKFHGYQIAES